MATESPRPGKSRRGTLGSRDSGTIRYAARAATSASGTRAQKTLPQ